MAKDKENNIVKLLRTPHFGNPEITTPDTGDPVIETMLTLTLDELTEYDNNPRRAPNAEFDALKASYLATGADKTLLLVTRRPGERLYFPAAGGNTRIRVLKELWEETRDERFFHVTCKFVPFTDDHQILVAHLSENDNRADYILIDRARTVCYLFDQLKSKDKSLSQRSFVEKLGLMGYPKLSPRQFRRFQYTVDLYEYIPQALDGGLHIKAIIRLHDIHDKLKFFLDQATGGDPDVASRFDDHWSIALRELDNPEGIDLDVLSDRIIESMASIAGERVPELETGQVVARLKHLWTDWQKDNSLSVSLRQGTSFKRENTDPARPGETRSYTPDEIDEFSRLHGYAGADSPRDGPDASAERIHDRRGTVDSGPSLPGLGSASSPAQPAAGQYDESLAGDVNWDARSGHDRSANENSLVVYRRYADHAVQFARSFGSHWGLDQLVSPLNGPERPAGFGFWIDLPEPEPKLDVVSRAAWYLLWDTSSIMNSQDAFLAMIQNRILHPESRIVEMYHAVAAGKASISKQDIDALPADTRDKHILRAFGHLVGTWVIRPTNYAEFLLHLPEASYMSLTRLVEECREMIAINFGQPRKIDDETT